MAPEKVENVYTRSPYVAQCYLYGDSLKSSCVALVVPDEEVLVGWAKGKEFGSTFKELCASEVNIWGWGLWLALRAVPC